MMKKGKQQPRAPLKTNVKDPRERVGVDIVGPLPVKTVGNRFTIVLRDYFTKW